MAKKKSKEELDIDDSLDLNDEEESSGGNKLLNAFIVVVVIAIWLVIFGLLIKMNVGGIGSMLRPFLKNVPVINRILPEATDEEIAEETGSKYKNLAEAIDRINELEAELAQYKDAGTADSSTIADLQAEIARLKVFEDNAQYYQDLKDKFDREVVYTDNAPDISNYKSWYESIDAYTGSISASTAALCLDVIHCNICDTRFVSPVISSRIAAALAASILAYASAQSLIF